ncbi:MAG: CHAP domain-containing protein [Marmoricola sp.]
MRIWRRTLRRVLLTRRMVAVASVAVCMALLGGLVSSVPVSATPLTNDYPAYLRAQPRDALVDPWYFYSRECTSFVAWRLNNDNHLPFSNSWGGVHWGNAYQWAAAARALGFAVNNTPSVGSVAWWNAGSASSRFGHVAWVAKIYSDHSILIEEYNYVSAGNYSQRHLYPGTYSWPSGFLHVGDLKMTNTAAPKVPGTPTVGATLTASPGTWRPTGLVSFAYAWYSNGVAISGARSQRFTPTAAQLGQKLTVKVTASMGGAKSTTVTSPASVAVVAGTLVASGTPVVVGAPQVGVPLVAQGATWKPTASVTYQWYSNGVAIPGATSATYTPQASDLGATITVTATATATGYKTAAATARTKVGVVPGVFKIIQSPSIRGWTTTTVGTPIRAVPGTWSPVATTYSYQWFNGTTAIPGATSASFTPTPDLLTKKLMVKVTAASPGYTTRTSSSGSTVAVVPGTFTAPALASLPTPAVGAPLTIDPGTITGTTTPTVSYQWKVGGTPIRGATSSTYTPTPGQLGKQLSVTVTASAPGYNTLTRTTPLSKAVQLGTLHVVRQPSLPSNPRYGVAYHYTPATWSATPSKVTYQWYANGVAIKGATGSTYTPSTSVVGQKLSMVERVSATGYHNASITTSESAVVMGGTTSVSPRPTISGSALVGHTLTAKAGAPFPSDATRSVRWLRDGVAIRNATKWTYTVTAADIRHRLTARVTVTRSLWTTASFTSAWTSTVVSPGTMVSRVTRLSNGKIRITVTVTAPGVSSPVGELQARWDHKLLATRTVSGGKVTFDLAVPSSQRYLNLVYFRDPRIRPVTQLNVPIH